MAASRALLVAGLAWLILLPLLPIVPQLLPPDPSLPNVAAMLGYNVGLAYPLVIGWAVLVALAAAALMRGAALPTAPAPAPEQAVPGPGAVRVWAERILVAGMAGLFAYPPALARFAPHIEDTYFHTVLWRMACGEVPYRDFEFVYGPLMIYPVNAWLGFFGFSMTGYFAFYALTQIAFYLVLVAILQRQIPQAGRRFLAFVLLLPFVFDFILGLNWIAWRYFAAVLVLLLLAGGPRSIARTLGAGAIIGVGVAYSWEYGIAALCTGLAIQMALLFEPGRGRILALAVLQAATALAVAALLIFWATGGAPGDWVEATLVVARAANALGLGQFAFRWTLHSAALFALLALLAVAIGAGLARVGRVAASEGDLQLVGAAVFLAVALKVALQRVDFLHLAVPFVPLLLVLLIGKPTRLLALPGAARSVALVLVAVAAIAQAIGHAPLGLLVAKGSARGLYHELTGRPKVGPFPSRLPGTEAERSKADPAMLALAARLAAPDLADRPVLFYGPLWDSAPRVGVCPVGYSFYDLLYSDARAPLAATARNLPGLIVAIEAKDHAYLLGTAPPEAPPAPPTGLRALAAWTSSVHFSQSPLENGIEAEMWRSALGDLLVQDFQVLDEVDGIVLLERKP